MTQNKPDNEQLIVESQYFGSINYINMLFQFSNIKIEQYESYQKMSFRNRCVVAGSNGLINLSVPLENGRNKKQLVKEIRTSYSGRWQVEHWRTIESCYNRSPYFEFYRDDVKSLIEKNQTFLLDKNMAILEWLKNNLKMPGEISLTDNYHKEYPAEITDKRNQILPKNFQEVPAGFKYTQVFEDRIGFQPNLCILDLLFCAGPGMVQ